MAKVGGARVNSGPKPDPNSFRSLNNPDTWLKLPADGYLGPVPAWPFPSGSKRERSVWSKLWRTPQAAAWVQLAVWPADVALFVRLSIAAEDGDIRSAGEARQWNDRLGLNPDAMLRKRWTVPADEVAAKRPTPKRSSVRSRLKVVNGDGD